MARKRKQKRRTFKQFKRRLKPKAKKLGNIILGVIFFLILIGSAFNLSFIFGLAFIVGFALSIYNGDVKKKPWKPVAIFTGALVVRIALDQYLDPVINSETMIDLIVSALIFLSIIVFGWKIKKV